MQSKIDKGGGEEGTEWSTKEYYTVKFRNKTSQIKGYKLFLDRICLFSGLEDCNEITSH